jgi:uracil phosphoribosyltransferase
MGIAEHKIIFVAVIAAPEGIAHINAQYPAVRIVGPVIDDGLSDQKFITPGIGDFGDRYFRTLESETF